MSAPRAAIVAALADELAEAFAGGRTDVTAPSSRDGGLSLDEGYEVGRRLAARRRADGHRPAGRKVGYASKAVWRALKISTVVWADMYDDTIVEAPAGAAVLPVGHLAAPRIEPEIVFTLGEPVPAGLTEPAEVLRRVSGVALGFEIVHCVYAGWALQPADFVAGYGLHARLIVGPERPVGESSAAALAEALGVCTVALACDGQTVKEGGGRNVLKNPALCLAELASAIAQRGETPLAAGDRVSTGSMTDACAIAPGQCWTARLEGVSLPMLTLDTTA